MLRTVSVRVAPMTSRAADYAPMAPACCNVCRTCTTTNVVNFAVGGLTVAAAAIAARVKRPPKR